MEPFVKRLITVVVSLFLIAYVGYQCVQVFYSPIKTETVNRYSQYKTIDTEGIAIRNERLIEKKVNGYIYYKLDNGSRVSKDGTIAEVYPSENDSVIQQQINQIDQEIAILEEIELQGTAGRSSLDLIDKQTRQVISRIMVGVNAPVLTDLEQWHAELRELMNKRQMVIGKVTEFKDRITELSTQRKQLANAFSKATQTITSPVAGYFVSSADGYESALVFDDAVSLTTEQVVNAMNGDPSVVPGNVIGKVVGDYKWYLACNVPAAEAGDLRLGNSITLVLPFVDDEAIPAVVKAINRDKSGKVTLVFECSYMSSALSSIRIETVQVRLARYEGLRVPSRSIVTNEEGEQGVYVAIGDTAIFRRVEILHAEPDYVICKETEPSGYRDGFLDLYDDLIVEGKGLYNGKVVR